MEKQRDREMQIWRNKAMERFRDGRKDRWRGRETLNHKTEE
jgi:hypothetical protein